ncbi:MAG: SDR family NAD(P)-dependent oxidoreductase [Pseudomonadota bacterium]
MSEQWALVTGGAQGIGAATAARLREDGLRVLIADRVPPTHGDLDEAVVVDLADVQATQAALNPLGERLALTRLVNNAGIVRPATAEEADPFDIDRVAAVNLRGPLVCLQAVLPAMRREGLGRIVNIASRVALGKELRTAYAASKAGLIGMTKTWALELGPLGVTANAIGPGPIRTELFARVNPDDDPRTQAIRDGVPVKRLGEPADVAEAVAFFCSDRAGFVTGQTLYVCGGLTIGGAGA